MRTTLAATLVVFLAACSPSLAPPPGVWQQAEPPPFNLYRTQFASLPGDRVLALGSSPNVANLIVTDTTQIYDASTNRWAATSAIPQALFEAAVVPLHSGQLLIAGGTDASGSALHSSYLFDPRNESWARAADMNFARSAPGAAVLGDGRVLVLGGASAWTGHVPAPDELADAEIYDPAANTWSAIPAMPMGGVVRPSAIELGDGRVLVAGGSILNTTTDRAALYDPKRESWRTLPKLPQPRSDATLEIDPRGRVVMMGGRAFAGSPEGGGFSINPALDSEFFDPLTLSWSLGSSPSSRQANNFLPFWAGVARLNDGRMLALGVQPSLAFTYDPSADFWQAAGRPPNFQSLATLVTLSDGRVLAVAEQQTYIYDPNQSLASTQAPAGWLDSTSATAMLFVIAVVMALLVAWRRLA